MIGSPSKYLELDSLWLDWTLTRPIQFIHCHSKIARIHPRNKCVEIKDFFMTVQVNLSRGDIFIL